MNSRQTADAVHDVLAHALRGDTRASWDALIGIITTVTGHRMYGVCCVLAEAGTRALKKLYAPAAFAGPSLYTLHQLQPAADAPNLWAARFVVAHANCDQAMTLALFETAVEASPEEFLDSVGALVTTVTGLIITATEGGAA